MKKIKIRCILLFIGFVLLFLLFNLKLCYKWINAEAKYYIIKTMNEKILSIDNRVIKPNILDTLKANGLNYLYEAGLPVKWLDKYIKLEKVGKNCYMYKLPVNKLLSEREYKYYYLHKEWKVLFLIKWDYRTWKRCKFDDYKTCNIYLTEKWLLKYTDDYECK